MWIMVLGLILFVGMHSVRIFAPNFRDARFEAIGNKWKGVYTIISLVGFVLMIWGYGLARPDAFDQYALPAWMVHLAHTLTLVSFVLFASTDMKTGYIKSTLKHPMMIGAVLWAVAHLLVNFDSASLVLFGVLLAWAIMYLVNVSRRAPRELAVPDVRMDILAIVIGVAAWFVFAYYLHGWLIGVEVFA